MNLDYMVKKKNRTKFYLYEFILLDFEINLLHLLEKLTNGSKVEINSTG